MATAAPSTIDPSASSGNEAGYVLGTGLDETFRLGLQHRLHSASAHRLWERAGVRPGLSVLDVGCGPGYATMDLGQIVGPGGRVVGVDESPQFLKQLGDEAAARKMINIERVLGDAQDLTASLGGSPAFDLAYARWVFCFLSRPEGLVRGLSSLVRPGGRVAVQDYFNYEYSIKLAPRSSAFEAVVDAVARSWRSRGGDPDIMGRLPGMFADAGFEIEHFGVTQRVARPGDTIWHWPKTFFESYIPKLVGYGMIGEEAARAALDDLRCAEASASSFILLPSVFDLVARRR
ncbi:MAG: methyltransferase domain-containing protein [Phycisphaeraceae bacterium]|nr:MAG: methyltransferase domain-containing protein [Phycisphaeraceae bacterium]